MSKIEQLQTGYLCFTSKFRVDLIKNPLAGSKVSIESQEIPYYCFLFFVYRDISIVLRIFSRSFIGALQRGRYQSAAAFLTLYC